MKDVVLQTAFTAAAAHARAHLASSERPLLSGRAVHIVRSTAAKAGGDASAAALARVAQAHGAKVGYLQLIRGAQLRCSGAVFGSRLVSGRSQITAYSYFLVPFCCCDMHAETRMVA